MKVNLYAILVVYNQCVSNSLSYQSVKNRDDIRLIVCDNSTKDYKNESIVLNDGFIYINMNGNKGISKAYNAALDTIKDEDAYVILMDDDTDFKDDYYQEIQEYGTKYDIYLPVVYYADGILSPGRLVDGISKQLDSLDAISMKDITAINSGMCISMKCFKDYRYDEHLFLDYVDHKFMNDMRDRSIKILNASIVQDFSSVSNSKEGAKIRYQLWIKDSKYFYLDYLKNKKAYRFVTTKRKLRLISQYKDLSFLKEGD